MRKLIWLVAVFCVLSGCKRPAPPAPPPAPPSPTITPTRVKMAVAKSALSLPVFIAIQEKYFDKEGVILEKVDCLSGRQCLDLLLSDQVQVATTGDVPIMFSTFERTDFSVFGTITSSSTDIKLITATKANIQAARDLVGKRVGVTPRTTNQYFLDTYLLLNGVDPKSVTQVPLNPDEMLAALHGDKVDAISIWEPFGHQVLSELGSGAKVLVDSGVYTTTFNLASKQGGVSEEVQLAILRAVEQAEQLIKANPVLAKTSFSVQTGIPPNVTNVIWDNYQYQLSLTAALLRTLQSEARWAQRENYTSNPEVPNFRALLNDGPLKKLKPGYSDLE